VAGRVHLVAADLTAAIAPAALDLLVANPPYLAREIIPALAPEVRDHDPHLALDGGPGGLLVITRLLADAPRVLRPGGRLVVEIGDEQGAAARTIAAASGLAAIDVHPDLGGRDRILTAERPR
jgi:release factor glutamine methyltransferase